MAKIFSNIAKSASNLAKRYNDSTVVNNLTTFTELRTTGGATTLLITNTPKNVYNQYTEPATLSQPQSVTYTPSQLISPINILRVRRSKFYEAFPIINANMTVTNVPDNDTLVEIKPYSSENADAAYAVDTSRMLQDSRFNPLVSGPRDILRIRRYLSGARGLRFKSFQQLLQSANTFGQSTSYNPVSVETMVTNYSNVSFGDDGILQRVPRIIETRAVQAGSIFQGRLQKQTVINIQTRLQTKYVGGETDGSANSPLVDAVGNLLSSTLRDRINRVNIPVPAFARNLANFANRRLGTNLTAGTKINLGQLGRKLSDVAARAKAAERLLEAGSNTEYTLDRNQTAYDSLYLNNLWPLVKETDGSIQNFESKKKAYLDRARNAINTLKGTSLNDVNQFTKPYPTDDYRSSKDYTSDVLGSGKSGYAEEKFGITSARYMKDPMNLSGNNGVTDAKNLENIQDKDYITFKIVVPGIFATGIKFRAFIEDINHSSKGQYDEVRYVGRPERFITYRGMNRNMTISLYLVAFSSEEIDTIWTRAEVLNKLTFPIQNSGGFMVPPLVKLTLGNIIVDQPGYVDNVDMRLQDIPWDIDKELPQAIKLNFSFNILEDGFKTQQTANKIFGVRRSQVASVGQTEAQRQSERRAANSPAGARDASAAATDAGAAVNPPLAPAAAAAPVGAPRQAPSAITAAGIQRATTQRTNDLGSLGSNVDFSQVNYRPGLPNNLRYQPIPRDLGSLGSNIDFSQLGR